MINVRQFRFGDNLGYALYGEREAIVIDGGAADAIQDFLQQRQLTLTLITNTHGHADHTAGNRRLAWQTKALLIEAADLRDEQFLPLETGAVTVYKTPGHSEDSVCFYTGHCLFTGDTLFNGTVGNCFTGDLKIFYQSIKKLMTLPPATIVYAGHDYVQDSMACAAKLEPTNEAVRHFLANYSPDHVFSTLKDELEMNPYLRLNEPSIVALLKEKGLPCETEFQRWESLMWLN